MNAYLDTSVLVSMFTVDDHSSKVAAWLPGAQDRLLLSDWTLTEFSSALAVAQRGGRLTRAEAEAAEEAVGSWTHGGGVLSVEASDIRDARRLIRLTALPLRAGDAMHLAVSIRCGCSVATLDIGMRRAALDLGLSVEDI